MFRHPSFTHNSVQLECYLCDYAFYVILSKNVDDLNLLLVLQVAPHVASTLTLRVRKLR